MAGWAQDVYSDIERTKRYKQASKSPAEINADVKFEIERESRATKALSPEEARVCRGLGLRPSQYVQGRNRD